MKPNSMSSKYIIDSYAWIEYFRASKSGEIAKKYIENMYLAHDIDSPIFSALSVK